MSWMDSWSRPKKFQPTPPPLYLTQGGENTPYCHSCGRVISSRKSEATKDLKTPAKYCSDRCKNRKPGKVDRRIEDTFVALLNGADASSLANHPANLAADVPVPVVKQDHGQKKKVVKGDPRITVMCEEVETIIFGSRFDPEKTHGRRKNRAKRTLGDDSEEDNYTDFVSQHGIRSVQRPIHSADASSESSSDEDDASDTSGSAAGGVGGGVALPIRGKGKQNDNIDNINNGNSTRTRTERHGNVLSDHKNFGAGKVRPGQLDAEVNFSVGGERGWAEKLEETPEMLEKRREGQRKADERESVRCAARRLCAFGYAVAVEVGDRLDESDDGSAKKKKAKGNRKGKSAVGMVAEEEIEQQESGQEKPKGKIKMKKCEAVMSGAVVESSFAKGEWGIRWREDQ